MHYNWNWHIFWELSPDGVHTYWDTLLSGLVWTLATSLAGWVIALSFGIAVGTLRTLPNRWLQRFAIAWVEVFRNIPLLVQMFLWFFVLPELLPEAAGGWLKALPNAPFVTAVLCLGFFTSARVAVQVAAGISALAGGQRLAALALGLSVAQAYRHILLPLGMRIVLPPLASEFLNIIKNSSVALTIGLMELTASARSMQEFSFQFFEAFAAATMIYVIANIIVVAGMTVLERKVALRGTLGEGTQPDQRRAA